MCAIVVTNLMARLFMQLFFMEPFFASNHINTTLRCLFALIPHDFLLLVLSLVDKLTIGLVAQLVDAL